MKVKNRKYKKLINKKDYKFQKRRKRKFLSKAFLIIIPLIFSVIILIYLIFFHKAKRPAIITDKYFCNESMKEVAERAKEFVTYSCKGDLMTTIPKKVNKYPKFSVIVPTHSNEKTIKRAVRSAQNQNFSDFEFIIIDDFSEDNTVKIIEELAKEDRRIKIIKNEKNRGTLYSRCVGTLLSKGLYILSIDSDDMFLIHDTFYYLSEEIDKMDIDVIKFRGFESYNQGNPIDINHIRLYNNFPTNKVLYQPELGKFGEKRCCLYMQCINAELYKKAIDLYGKERMNLYVTFLEDCIIHFIIYQHAKSLKLFLKIGYAHIIRRNSDSRSIIHHLANKYHIYLYEVFLEFGKHVSWAKEWIVQNVIKIMQNSDFQKTLQDIDAKNYIKNFIKKIISNREINSKIKEELMNSSLKYNLMNKNEFN